MALIAGLAIPPTGTMPTDTVSTASFHGLHAARRGRRTLLPAPGATAFFAFLAVPTAFLHSRPKRLASWESGSGKECDGIETSYRAAGRHDHRSYSIVPDLVKPTVAPS